MDSSLYPIPIEQIYAAQERLSRVAIRSPLIRLEVENYPGNIFLKLENLQPVGSFKLRGAANVILAKGDEAGSGVWTASAGNMGYALAWMARKFGVPCMVVVPHDAPAVKLQAISRMGALIHPLPFDLYQDIQCRGEWIPKAGKPPSLVETGHLIHPFADPMVMAGNAVIGLEILEDFSSIVSSGKLDRILVPYGGGGLSCGIASAIQALRPGVTVYACELETAAPLAASLEAGRPVRVDYTASFVSGMGAPFVFPQMWPLVKDLLSGSLVVSLRQTADAIRMLAENCRVIVEGAGAVSVAAALASAKAVDKSKTRKNGLDGNCDTIVCIVSGGNLDFNRLSVILEGHVPE